MKVADDGNTTATITENATAIISMSPYENKASSSLIQANHSQIPDPEREEEGLVISSRLFIHPAEQSQRTEDTHRHASLSSRLQCEIEEKKTSDKL